MDENDVARLMQESHKRCPGYRPTGRRGVFVFVHATETTS